MLTRFGLSGASLLLLSIAISCGFSQAEELTAPQVPISGTVVQPAVRVTLEWGPSLQAPEQTVAVVSLDPVEHRARYSLGDRLLEAEWSPLDLHPVSEMRLCFSLDEPCQPQGEWGPFKLRQELTAPGEQPQGLNLHLAVEFRDGSGRPIPAFVDPERLLFLLRTSLNIPGSAQVRNGTRGPFQPGQRQC